MKLLITIFLMLLLAVVGLVFFVNPNQYKDLIASKIEEKIHRPFTINGDVAWHFLPSIGFTLEGVQIGQAHSKETFADIKKVYVYPELMPLLHKQININELSLVDSKFYFAKQTTLTISNIHANLQLNMNKSTPDGFIEIAMPNARIDGELFSGNLNAQFKLDLSKTLNGSGQFDMHNGSIRGIDLGYWLSMGQSLLKTKNLLDLASLPIEAVTLSNNKKTTFDKLTGTFTITDNVFSNNDLVVYGPSFYATGHGHIDWQKQYIDYALQVRPSQNSNVQIPLILAGPLNHPKIGIDPKGIQTLLVDTAKIGVQDTLNQPQQLIKDTMKNIKNLIP